MVELSERSGSGGDRFSGDRYASERYPGDRFPASRMKAIYALTEKDGKSFFTRIGVGFVNKDDSITIKLDAFPASGTMQVREYQRPEDREPRRGREPLSAESDRATLSGGF